MTDFLVYTRSLVVLVFILSVNAFGGVCETALKEFPLSMIDYVGIKFTGTATCIEAIDEKDARSRCSAYLINPANPQYTDSGTNAMFSAGGRSPSIDVNPRGFFYCIPRNGENKTKQALCKTEVISKRSDWDTKDKYEFKWKPKASGSSDGDCTCREKNNTSAPFKVCNREPEPPPDKCSPSGLVQAKPEEFESAPNAANLICVAQVCKCGDNKRFFPSDVAKENCAKQDDPKPPPVVPVPPVKPPAVVATQPDSNLKKCVDDWKNEALNCKKESDDAKKNCVGSTKMSKEDKETASAVDAARNVYTAPKSGSGMQQECFTAGLVASGAKSLLGPKSEVCESSVTSCLAACSAEKLNKMREGCWAQISTVLQPADEIYATPNQTYFMEGDVAVREITENASKVCSVDAKKGESEIGSLLSGVGDALASSLQCMCKTSSGAANCDALPTPGACDLNPAQAGCVYGAISVCTPGAGYDAKSCNCQLNPKDVGCPGGAASGGLSNFASPSIKGNGLSAGGGSPSLAGGLKSNGALPDLPRGSNDDSSSGNQFTLGAGGTSPSGGGAPGGGSGGVGGSSGGEPPPAAAEAAAEEKGLGGLFNQAKTFLKDALGKKSTTGASLKNGTKTPTGMDPNKLRPARGIASKTGMGSRNQDIWKMSNSCMYAETCPGNMNSFLEAPLKQK